MSNILKVTTPLVGYENNNTIRTNQNPLTNPDITNIPSPIVPEKVVRPDGRNDAGRNAQEFKLNYESNFNSFIRLLKESPDSVEDLAQVLRQTMGALRRSDLSDKDVEALTRFFGQIGIKEGDMSEFVRQQADMGIRFKGPFFDLLRQVFQNTSSSELKSGILDFLRRYADMASGDHIMQTIETALAECQDHMYSGPAAELGKLLEQLKNLGNVPKGETEQKASLLKDRVLPFLNKYITATHNRGGLRNITVRMAYQLSRYENGSMEGLKNVFSRLQGYKDFRTAFGDLDVNTLEAALHRAADDSGRSDLGKGFLQLLRSGMRGESGVETRQIMQSFVHNALLGESVYMPVLHLMLPMLVEGRMVYSELWVDPDAEEEGKTDKDQDGRAVKMLVKFDIEQVGFFDLFFVYKDGKMSLQLDYPDAYRDRDNEIRDNVGRILAENNIEVENFVTGSSRESIPIEEAFPKIAQRRSMINVRV